MTDPKIFTVKLSQEEILLLSIRLRQPIMFGIDEKLLKLSPEEGQRVVGAAELSLLQRDFLRRGEDGNLRLAPLLTAIIVTCSAPEKTFLITRAIPGETSYSLMVHQSGETFVNHAIEADKRHTFTVLPDVEFMLNGLINFAHANDYAKPDCGETIIPDQIFKHAKDLADESKEAEVVSGLGNYMTAQAAQMLYQTLNKHEATVSVMRTLHAEKPEDIQNNNLALIQGGGWQWILRSFDGITGKMMNIIPTAPQDLHNDLEKLAR